MKGQTMNATPNSFLQTEVERIEAVLAVRREAASKARRREICLAAAKVAGENATREALARGDIRLPTDEELLAECKRANIVIIDEASEVTPEMFDALTKPKP